MKTEQIEITEAMQAILDQYAEFNTLPIDSVSPAQAREMPPLSEAVRAVVNSQKPTQASSSPEAIAKVEHLLIPGKKSDILVRVYTPNGDGPFPILLYFHGGGFVIANLDAYDSSCRSIANMASCMVVSVAYSQAPEKKFPTAIEEGYSVYQWLLENAAEINGDHKRIAVGGESAGGNIAAVLTLMCVDRNAPSPVHQLLIYPITDYNFETASYEENAEAKPLSRDMMMWFCNHYLNHIAETASPYVSPLRAASLRNVPSATIITAEIDPLRSEGEAYARKLEAEGIPVKLQNYMGVTHEFFGMKAVLEEAKDAHAFAAKELKAAFAS